MSIQPINQKRGIGSDCFEETHRLRDGELAAGGSSVEKDGWTIGISCKQTLRERWKQVSSADGHALSRYKIKEVWHLITYDNDLSDDKLTMLGQQRQVFYLDADTERYKSAANHVGMKKYVRPLNQFISDIRREQKG